MHRFDKAWGPRRITQHLAQRAHGHRDHRLTHRRLRPDRLEQRVFGHELARLRHQAAQDRKGFGGQWDRLVATPQPFVTPIKLERSKDETLRLLHRSPLPVSARSGLRGPT